VWRHLLEYQDYVLAYRLRALVGGKTRPLTGHLSLAAYARLRLERQALAKDVLKAAITGGELRQVEALTEALNFGFGITRDHRIFKARHRTGRVGALESSGAFVEALLTRRERAELTPAHADLVAVYYLGLLRRRRRTRRRDLFPIRADLDPLREQLPFFVLPKETFPVLDAL
jgi:hypothetical protein